MKEKIKKTKTEVSHRFIKKYADEFIESFAFLNKTDNSNIKEKEDVFMVCLVAQILKLLNDLGIEVKK